MERRTVLLASGGVVFAAGCLGVGDDGGDGDDGQVFLEVQRTSTAEADARVTEYDCVSGSDPLRSALAGATDRESGEARSELSTVEAERVRATLNDCYASEEGPTYVRRDEALFKVEFLKQH